jgi:hypothetical protein
LLDANKKKPTTVLLDKTHTIKENFRGYGKHLNHFPNYNLIECEKAKSLVYEKALHTTDNPREIVTSIYEQLKDKSEALAIMPTLETMTNTIKKMRQRQGRRPDKSNTFRRRQS